MNLVKCCFLVNIFYFWQLVGGCCLAALQTLKSDLSTEYLQDKMIVHVGSRQLDRGKGATHIDSGQ